MTPEDLRDELLAEIARRFFPGVDARRWGQERRLLVQAIAWPARWLNERGAKLPGRRYRAILLAVLADIDRHRNAKQEIKRMSAYIAHCVQEHMSHHGEEYYEEAKAARPAGLAASQALRKLRPEPADHVTQILAETHAALSQKRRRKPPGAETQKELFQ